MKDETIFTHFVEANNKSVINQIPNGFDYNI